MPESIKKTILSYLEQHKDERINVKELHQALAKNGFKFTYSTVLKWVDILHAEGSIVLEDWGNVKIIWWANGGLQPRQSRS